jgi:hypothetical protein
MKKRELDFFRNKSGLSMIVISLILILLSLVAIGLVWAVVSGIIGEASDEVGLDSLTISMDITNAYEYNGNISVNVKRNVGKGEVARVMFLLSDGEDTESYTSEISIGELESKKFNVPVSELNSTDIEEVSVAAIFLSSGGEETLGGVLDTYTITQSYTGGTPLGGDGETNPPLNCTANCTGKVCGDDGCGGSCGTCESGLICTNGMCVSSSCVPDSNETTCGTSNCGTKLNNCGQIVTCGVF